MNTELDPSTQTGLVSYYSANEGITGGTNTGLTTVIDLMGTNNGSMSNFTLSGGSSNFIAQFSGLTILPLSLVSFTAQKENNSVLLKWSTASEQNTNEFIIQHSINGTTWENTGLVEAAGNSNTLKEYSYVHTHPVNGVNYYRLQEKDIDGRSSYSDIRSVKFTMNDVPLIVLNNPVTNGVLMVKPGNSSHLTLYNSEGRMLWQKQVNAGTESINVSGYAKGTYLLKADNQAVKIIID